ncbi:Repeat domain-containing protein [Balamuthia mandrillaris]
MLLVSGFYRFLYRSDGDGSFVDATGSLIAENSSPFHPVTDSSADWGDVNGDQHLDFVVCGKGTVSPWSAVFLQTSGGQFRDATEELFLADPLPQVTSCFVRFVDFDGDAHLDLCITGAGGGGLFRNNGSAFEDVTRREFGLLRPFGGIDDGMDVSSTSAGNEWTFRLGGRRWQRLARLFCPLRKWLPVVAERAFVPQRPWQCILLRRTVPLLLT